MLPQHGTQGCLSEHVGGGKVVLNLNDSPFGIDHVKVEHRVNLHGNVVAGDHILSGYFDDLDTQIHSYHFLKERNQQHEARPLNTLKTAERKDDCPLVFTQDSHTRPDQYKGYEQESRCEI